jgi:hypothetical protein
MNGDTIDVFYYSNYCEYSKNVLQFISRHGMIDKLSCLCIDKRIQDPTTYQLQIQNEKGQYIPLPPVIYHVPSLLCVKKKCTVVTGAEACIQYLANLFQIPMETNSSQGPRVLGSFEPLSSYGTNHYVSIHSPPMTIPTPPETYQPDKIGSNISISSLQEQRLQSIHGM